MSTKIILLDDHFSTGEPTVQLITTLGRNGAVLRERTSLEKRAAHSPAEDYIRSVMPEPGKTTVLVIGLGDHETYGANKNGDGFPSEPIKGKIAADQVLTKHYKSYEKAHVFEHHVNDNPAKAIGRVKKAFWNPTMRRVELIEDFDHAKAPHLLEKIAAGQYPAKSMGTKIPYDVCTSCGNRAKTRKDYCDHLKYQMNEIDPKTGVKYAALNPSCDFFDSSWVLRPADRTGWMLKKVAHENVPEIYTSSYLLGEHAESLKTKSAALSKAADIEKVLAGAPASSVSNLDKSDAALIAKHKDYAKDGPKKDHGALVRIMIAYKPSDVIGTAEDSDLPLGLGDLINYFMSRMAPGDKSADLPKIKKAASDNLGLILDTFAAYPRFLEDTLKLGGFENISHNPDLAKKLASILSPPQDIVQDYQQRRLTPEWMRPDERPLTDVVSWTAPSGQNYQTTYGNVQRTHDALVEHGAGINALKALPLLGGSALLGAAALGMGLHPRYAGAPQVAAGVGALGLGALGLGQLHAKPQINTPTINTDQGETISGWTEMVPTRANKFASLAPELVYLMKRANDVTPTTPSKVDSANYWYALKHAEIRDSLTPALGPTLDFEKVALIVGQALLAS